MNQEQLNKLLQSTRYNQSEQPPIEQVVFRIQFKTIGSLGDFILFSGRPKSGKTKFISGAIGAAISRQEIFSMNIRLPNGKTKVSHFDTEQSKYSHFKMMRLVMQLINREQLPDHFDSYRCRSLAPAQTIAVVEHYLKLNPDCGILFLDGLLDLVVSMNDEKHSNYLKQWLKRITEQYNVLLAAVIHRGFSADKSIGQIGSEGERAAQTVLLVEKNKETKQYILRGEYMRDSDEFEPIAIHYNKQLEIWEQTDYIEKPQSKPGKTATLKRRPHEYEPSEHAANVFRLFNSEAVISYDHLKQRIIEVYGVGRNWATECIPLLEREDLIYRTEQGFTNRKQLRIAE